MYRPAAEKIADEIAKLRADTPMTYAKAWGLLRQRQPSCSTLRAPKRSQQLQPQRLRGSPAKGLRSYTPSDRKRSLSRAVSLPISGMEPH
jgi:hypothetical protein